MDDFDYTKGECVKDEHGATAWFKNGNGNVEVYIGTREPPFGGTIICHFMSWENMVKVYEGLKRIIKKENSDDAQ